MSEDPRAETLKEGVSSLRIPAGARKEFQLLYIHIYICIFNPSIACLTVSLSWFLSLRESLKTRLRLLTGSSDIYTYIRQAIEGLPVIGEAPLQGMFKVQVVVPVCASSKAVVAIETVEGLENRVNTCIGSWLSQPPGMSSVPCHL